jgi:hypothetical protein
MNRAPTARCLAGDCEQMSDLLATLLRRIAAPDPALVAHARIKAARMVHDGRDSPAAQRYINSCWHYHRPTLCAIIFTRESGYHSGGWWKNPDYERCFHLSLRFLGYDGAGVGYGVFRR